jgi:hypothetical protein
MINVSTEYFESINAPMRRQMKFVVGVGVANIEMRDNSEYTDNGHMRYSNVNGLRNLFASNKTYTTAEANMYLLDGEHEISPIQDNFQGYVSSVVSGADSVFATPPIITINSEGSYDLIGFTILFDSENNDYATDFDIVYYDINGSKIRTKNVSNNNLVKYIDDEEIKKVNKIVITFYKTHNYSRRLRVTGITLGVYEEFYGNDNNGGNAIKTLTHNTSISPLMKEIPANDFSFTIDDEKANYNPENPTGIWKYTKKGQIVTLKYIQTLNNGEEEAVIGGRFYLTERPNTEGVGATFEAVSRLESLEQTYDEGQYYLTGRSYYSLFEDVFKFCGLSETEYSIDEDLKNMITHVPLYTDSAKNCIQLLCQACGKIAFEDTTGKIWIKDNNDFIDEYVLNLQQNYSYPKYSEEVSEVRNIIITKYTVGVNSDIRELAKATFTMTGNGSVTINYSMSTNHTYEISGATVTNGVFYGECCKLDLSVNGTSEVSIVIRGNEIEETATNIIHKEAETGFDCELDFKMLSDNVVADRIYSMYRKYLNESKRYDIDYRGNPELRPNDIIQIDTRFAEGINAMITASSFTWDNGASGSLTLKNFTSS